MVRTAAASSFMVNMLCVWGLIDALIRNPYFVLKDNWGLMPRIKQGKEVSSWPEGCQRPSRSLYIHEGSATDA